MSMTLRVDGVRDRDKGGRKAGGEPVAGDCCALRSRASRGATELRVCRIERGYG